eukprot:s3126_g5.t3
MSICKQVRRSFGACCETSSPSAELVDSETKSSDACAVSSKADCADGGTSTSQGSKVLEAGREIIAILSASRPQGLLMASSSQLFEAASTRQCRFSKSQVLKFLQGLFGLCGGTWDALKMLEPMETAATAARLFLACWAAACSWDIGFLALDCWSQVSTGRPAEAAAAMDLLRPLFGEVSSLYGLFTLLQVVDIGPDGEAGWARAAGETKKAWAAWGLGLGLGGSADPAAGIQRLAASLSLAGSSKAKNKAKADIVNQMQIRLRAKGSSCPVCLEDLGPDADRIVVAPCSHAVHWSCYASAVRAKSYQAGRCLMCRKVAAWSNVTISRLLRDFQGFLARTAAEEDWGSCDEFPREFLVASACADLSEHLPLLHEVSMSLESFSALYAAQKIEVTPSGAWMVAQELSAVNASGRGPLAGPGAEAVGTRPASVRLPVGSLLVSASSPDGNVCLSEIEVQSAAAFQPRLLFEMIRAANGLFIWRVPLPMHLFWNEEFQSKFEVRGVHLCREKVWDLLRHPQAEMFGRHQSATEMP